MLSVTLEMITNQFFYEKIKSIFLKFEILKYTHPNFFEIFTLGRL